MVCCCGASRRGRIPEGPIEFATVALGQHSLVDTAAVFLVKDSTEWTRIWQLAEGNKDPLPPAPGLNFADSMLVAAFLGRRTSAGHEIDIAEITREETKLRITIKTSFRAGGAILPVLTSPYHIVRIPRGDYELVVEYQTEENEK